MQFALREQNLWKENRQLQTGYQTRYSCLKYIYVSLSVSLKWQWNLIYNYPLIWKIWCTVKFQIHWDLYTRCVNLRRIIRWTFTIQTPLRWLDGERINDQISLKRLNMVFLAIMYCWIKNNFIIEFWTMFIPLYIAFCPKEVYIALKWPRPSSLL